MKAKWVTLRIFIFSTLLQFMMDFYDVLIDQIVGIKKNLE